MCEKLNAFEVPLKKEREGQNGDTELEVQHLGRNDTLLLASRSFPLAEI